ncbi:efflux RND transporter periplasmic adaptor subunit [Granulicella sp. L60]|uniref:efflux RND transporter periplasmic adaptor subunit n=1 Tax=Granulicella sp. L60 TaxID=1641866 RepID=UPI00131C08F8|nr:efflux RND transporter periplasmic adaptor subunit [Granulicella sp. L60]
MSDPKDQQGEHSKEQEPVTLSQWHGDALDSTAKLPLHKETRSDEQKHEEEEAHKRKMHRIVIWTVIGAVILFLLVFLLGYLPRRHRDKQTEAQAESQKNAVPAVQVITLKNAPPANDLTVPGTTTPLTQANVYGRANGYLKRRYVDIGDRVHQGQLLAIIDAPDLDQQVDQARASLRQAQSQLAQQQSQLDLARVTWERWKVLVAKGVFSRQDGDQRETDFNAQLSNVAAAQRNVQSFEANLGHVVALQQFERVVAPFDGIITARNVDVGALISAQGSGGGDTSSSPASSGSPTQSGSTNTSGTTGNVNSAATPSTGGAQGGSLFSIAQINKLRILVSVPEGYSAAIHPGMRASLHFQSFPKESFYGLITRTAGSIDLNSRTLLTEVQVDNKDGRLLSGMYVVVNFMDLHGDPGITIPGDAVVVRNDKNQVALVRNDIVHLQPIDIGRDFGPSVEVLNGLKPGDMLITTVTDDVREGVKVQPREVQTAGSNTNSHSGQQRGQQPGGPAQYGDQKQADAQKSSAQQQKGGGDQKNGGKQ